jgi:hypothetical protein
MAEGSAALPSVAIGVTMNRASDGIPARMQDNSDGRLAGAVRDAALRRAARTEPVPTLRP